jgi:hypothetical protein
MAEIEERENKDESIVPGLLGEWNLYTGSRSTSYHAM